MYFWIYPRISEFFNFPFFSVKYFLILSFKRYANSSILRKSVISFIISLSFSLSHIDLIILLYSINISLNFKQTSKQSGSGLLNSFKILFQKSLLKYTKRFFISSEYLLIDVIPLVITVFFSFLSFRVSFKSILLKLIWLLFPLIYLLYIFSFVLSITVINVSISEINFNPILK